MPVETVCRRPCNRLGDLFEVAPNRGSARNRANKRSARATEQRPVAARCRDWSRQIMSVSERATARRAATTWAQHARRLAEILCSRTRKPRAALSARFSLTLAIPTLSRRRCSFHRLGILLTLLGGASATTATFNFTSRAPSGILGDRRRGAGDPQATRAPAGRPVAGDPRGSHRSDSRISPQGKRPLEEQEILTPAPRPVWGDQDPTYMLRFIIGAVAATSRSIMTAPRAPGVERASAP